MNSAISFVIYTTGHDEDIHNSLHSVKKIA